MTIYDLIPTDKSDTAAAEKLWYFSHEEIKPIFPDLLIWLQDLHWPVSVPVSKYLQAISEHLTDDILDILKGEDNMWKHGVIVVFGVRTEKPLDPRLLNELKRIATNPTPGEQAEGVAEVAQEVIEKHTDTGPSNS